MTNLMRINAPGLFHRSVCRGRKGQGGRRGWEEALGGRKVKRVDGKEIAMTMGDRFEMRRGSG